VLKLVLRMAIGLNRKKWFKPSHLNDKS